MKDIPLPKGILKVVPYAEYQCYVEAEPVTSLDHKPRKKIYVFTRQWENAGFSNQDWMEVCDPFIRDDEYVVTASNHAQEFFVKFNPLTETLGEYSLKNLSSSQIEKGEVISISCPVDLDGPFAIAAYLGDFEERVVVVTISKTAGSIGVKKAWLIGLNDLRRVSLL